MLRIDLSSYLITIGSLYDDGPVGQGWDRFAEGVKKMTLSQRLNKARAEMREDGTAKTQTAAVVHGLKFYDTGKMCRYGHISRRYASTGACVVCVEKRNRGMEAGWLAQANEMLAKGHLPKDRAERMGSPFYCTGAILPCGHAGQQRVIDDACRICVQQAEHMLS